MHRAATAIFLPLAAAAALAAAAPAPAAGAVARCQAADLAARVTDVHAGDRTPAAR